jgi:hypothetical protein
VMRFWGEKAECAVFAFKRHSHVLSTYNPIILAMRRFYPPYPTEPVPCSRSNMEAVLREDRS